MRLRRPALAHHAIGGVDIGACSHGVGGPSTDIAIVELSNCGADTLAPGDLIIATGALRLTGTMDAYVDKAYPAVADHEVLMAKASLPISRQTSGQN